MYYEKAHNPYEIDFGQNTIVDLEAVVNAGKWLDENRHKMGVPKDWRDRVDTTILDLGDPHLCIIGQAADYNIDVMHEIVRGEDSGELAPYIFSSSDIQPAWVEYFHAYRLATHA